jgi:hypothetical protein
MNGRRSLQKPRKRGRAARGSGDPGLRASHIEAPPPERRAKSGVLPEQKHGVGARRKEDPGAVPSEPDPEQKLTAQRLFFLIVSTAVFVTPA